MFIVLEDGLTFSFFLSLTALTNKKKKTKQKTKQKQKQKQKQTQTNTNETKQTKQTTTNNNNNNKKKKKRGFYASYTTTLLMNMPYHAVLVSTNESLKLVFNQENETLFGYFLSGAGAGAAAAAITNPLDVVKTRLQTQSITSSSISNSSYSSAIQDSCPKSVLTTIPSAAMHTSSYRTNINSNNPIQPYKGLVHTVKRIAAEEGIKGFTRGIVPRLLFHAPAAAISWTSYEFMKSLLMKPENLPVFS